MSDSDAIARRALDVFEDCLEWPETGTALITRLERHCEGDTALLAAVTNLLQLDRDATRVIPTDPTTSNHASERAPPERLGNWRLSQLIGVGGMGSIYRGERDDGLFEQTVAIKLMRRGLLSTAAEARFADERRMLARLRHTNIAQLYDGGTDPSGQAWLAMEYVDGQSITQYVAATAASRDARLALFSTVCHCVQFAHQNLIVHADIKPANILVTPAGTVKLLDFGIARWLAEGAVDPVATAAPATGMVGPLTPAYAAPERLTGSVPSIAGDVYSLGALLAELLDPDSHSTAQAADLAAIIAKARAVDTAQRYPTVAALTEDVERSRRQLPVTAQLQTWRYLASCFLRRNYAIVALASGAVAILVGVTVLTTMLYLRAERARAEADQRFQEVRQLSKFMIFDLYDQLARVPGATTSQHSLAATAQSYLDRLAAQKNAPVDLRLEVSVSQSRLAGVMGVPQQPNLGDLGAARRGLDTAVEQLQQLAAELPSRRDIAIELARSLLLRARIAIWSDQKLAVATPEVRHAAALLDASQPTATDPTEMERQLEVQLLRRQLEAEVADWSNQPADVTTAARTTLTELDRWPSLMRNDGRHAVGRGRALTKLGDGLYYGGDKPASLESYREAAAILRDADTRWPDRPAILVQLITATWSIATTLANSERAAESIPVFDETATLLERLQHFEKNDAALMRQANIVQSARAEALAELGRYSEAIASLNALINRRLERVALAPDDASAARGVAYELVTLANVYDRAKRAPLACRALSDAAHRFEALRAAGTLNPSDQAEYLEPLRRRLQSCNEPPNESPNESP